ncbi:MAG: aldehyde dehydrogenase family protein [Chlorobi bacterium]|nr:aldehyde dehydrogenase family protein [Chlorobiota bacterium]MCI0716045.1 aldehyde dehydrogenase family protein [Chlorobiota bacterium]
MPKKFISAKEFSSSDKVKTIVNPFSNKTVGEVYLASEKHFGQSAEYLTKAFEQYKNLPTYKKQELLYKVSEKIAEGKKELAKLITDETGKPIRFSMIEIDRAALTFRLGAEECSRINGEVLPLDLLKGSENKMGIVRRFPLGLVLGITPWNFPVNLVAHKVSPALASSNVILIKPSSNSMLCGIELGKIIFEACNELGIPHSINVLTLSGSNMDRHIPDSRIKLISFTGSSDVGWGIKNKSGKQRISLELGGNAGVIINDDADINTAVSKIIIGGFAQAGQSCISVQRVYVHEKVYDEFRSKMIDETKKVKFGDPYDEDTISGPMITEAEATRAEKWIAEAKDSGANVPTGGSRNGAVLEPTVIENAPNSANVKCNEVFAPVITIDKFSKFEEAVSEINNSRFGLQAAVFTNNMQNILYAYNNIHTGGVIINEPSSYRMDAMPYGGVKDSGNTREGVRYAIKEMTEEKILVI